MHAVKIPSHLNLAMCSMKLGNFEHSCVHCTQVLANEEFNTAATNSKALYRRGVCQTSLGNLSEARADLVKAAALSPSDAEIRKAIKQLQTKEGEYRQQQKGMTKKMLAGAGGSKEAEAAAEAVLEAAAVAAAEAAFDESEEARAVHDAADVATARSLDDALVLAHGEVRDYRVHRGCRPRLAKSLRRRMTSKMYFSK